MARVPRFEDGIDRSVKQVEHIRQLRSQKRCHTESKTVIVSGEIATGLYVGPYRVAINTDGNNPEYKEIYEFPGGSLRVGTCTVQWTVNGVNVGDPQLVTTTPDEHPFILDPPFQLADGDRVQPTFTAASVDATDYDGPVVMNTVAA